MLEFEASSLTSTHVATYTQHTPTVPASVSWTAPEAYRGEVATGGASQRCFPEQHTHKKKKKRDIVTVGLGSKLSPKTEAEKLSSPGEG